MTFDIDFESGLSSVNEWDDVLHVLCDPALSLLDFSQGSLGLPGVLERWWHAPKNGEGFDLIWKTLLARTLREHCRRMWYWQIMPNTYRERYGAEPDGYYLRLAQAAAGNVDGFGVVKEYLERCPPLIRPEAPSIAPALRAAFPFAGAPPQNGFVFVSYSHKDSVLAKKLACDLREAGIRIWIDHRGIVAGEDIVTSIDTVLADATAVIALISSQSLESPWCKQEWSATLNARLGGKSISLIPIVVDSCAVGPLLQNLRQLNLDKDGYEATLRNILSQLKSPSER